MSPDEALRRAILESIREQYAHRPTPTVREVIPPPDGASEKVSRFTLVWLSDGSLGASWNLLESPEDRGAYDAQGLEAWRGRDALEAAAELLRPERVRRILGFAAVGALSQGLFQDGAFRPDTATDLDRYIRKRLGNAVYRIGVHRFAGEGAVQVDQVQAPRARIHPALRHFQRIVGENGFVFHAALAQAHAFPVLQVNGRDQQHACILILYTPFLCSGLTVPAAEIA